MPEQLLKTPDLVESLTSLDTVATTNKRLMSSAGAMLSLLLLIRAKGVSLGNSSLKKVSAAAILASSPFSSPAQHNIEYDNLLGITGEARL